MATRQTCKVMMINPSRFACLYYAKSLAHDRDIAFRYATDLSDGLRLAEEVLPTVVLAQATTPSPELLDFLAAVRDSPSMKDVPLLLLSDIDDEGFLRAALAAGVSEIVDRRVEATELADRIRVHSRRYVDLLGREIGDAGAAAADPDPARVFMIDDSRTVCLSIQRRLEDLCDRGEVIFASCNDPAAALEPLKTFRPTVILLDLEMPEITGFDLLSELKRDPTTRDVPVIVLSGITDPAIKAEVFNLGADDYAEKEMHQTELSSRIQYHSRAYLNDLRLNDSIRELLETQKRLEIQRNFVRKTFGRYLSDEVVKNILETPQGLRLGGEKREISIMMSDLRGFTSLAERLDPESVLSIINNYLRVMTDILFKHGATIDEFIGDAILAMFGAPEKRPNDAHRAVACALEMQLAMERVNAWNRQLGYPDVAMGIGINTGEVVVGNIGSERRSKYGIVGRHVNLAGRIESCTVGGQILISASTHRACGEILRIDGQLEVQPKGVDEPVSIYEVGGIGGAYNLYLPDKNGAELFTLAVPLSLRFSVVVDKHSGSEVYDGTLLRLGKGIAEIETDVPLGHLVDLRLTLLDAAGRTVSRQIYAKVTGIAERGQSIRIAFTTLAPEAEAFLNGLGRSTNQA